MAGLTDQGRVVVAAFEQNDQLAIRRTGWWEPWEACHSGWAPKQECTARQFVAYAKWLADEDPEVVCRLHLGLVRGLLGPDQPWTVTGIEPCITLHKVEHTDTSPRI